MPPTASHPHVLLTYGPFIGFVGFFPVSQGYSCLGVVRHGDYSADSSTSLAQCGFVGGFSSEFRDFRASLGSSWEILPFFPSFPLAIPMLFFANSACLFTSFSLL